MPDPGEFPDPCSRVSSGTSSCAGPSPAVPDAVTSSADASGVGPGTSSRTNLPGAIRTQVAGVGSIAGIGFARLRPRTLRDSTGGDPGESDTVGIGTRAPDVPTPSSGPPGGGQPT